MNKAIIPFLIASMLPCIANANELTSNHDKTSGSDVSEQISLTTYILDAIAKIKDGNPQQERLKSCVTKISSFAPGGGDSTRQQRGYNGSIPMTRIMTEALTNSAPLNRAASSCLWHLNNLSITYANPDAEVMLGRNGAPNDQSQYSEIQNVIGEKTVCAIALSEMSIKVDSLLAQNPPKTDDEAIQTATKFITDNMHLYTKSAATNAILHPNYTVGDNGGSTRPYNPLTPMTTAWQSMEDGGKPKQITGHQTSQLAQTNMGISAVAVGGIFSYTTRPAEGYVATYDSKSFSVTKNGATYYDASTLAGRHGTVTISGTGAYSASVNETGSAFRSAAIEETSICALAINDFASQLTDKFLKPRVLPLPSSKFAQSTIKLANIKSAFARADSIVKGKEVEQDLDGRGAVWKINGYAFTMHDSGMKIIFSGQEWFDYNHISGRGYTVRATSSNAVTSGFTGE